MNKQKILDLANLIESKEYMEEDENDPDIAADGFNMNEWSFPCGSPACIAGWAVFMEGEWPTVKDDADARVAGQWAYDNCRPMARNVLGITETQAQLLFTPEFFDMMPTDEDGFIVGEEYFDETITPSWAAACLRHLAEYNEVAWFAVYEERH